MPEKETSPKNWFGTIKHGHNIVAQSFSISFDGATWGCEIIWEGVLYFCALLHFYDPIFWSLLRGYMSCPPPSSLSPFPLFYIYEHGWYVHEYEREGARIAKRADRFLGLRKQIKRCVSYRWNYDDSKWSLCRQTKFSTGCISNLRTLPLRCIYRRKHWIRFRHRLPQFNERHLEIQLYWRQTKFVLAAWYNIFKLRDHEL